MRFVINAQLPPTLGRSLNAHSHHAEDVADIGLRDADGEVNFGAVIPPPKDQRFKITCFKNPRSTYERAWGEVVANTIKDKKNHIRKTHESLEIQG